MYVITFVYMYTVCVSVYSMCICIQYVHTAQCQSVTLCIWRSERTKETCKYEHCRAEKQRLKNCCISDSEYRS